jgi:hypothetical protein
MGFDGDPTEDRVRSRGSASAHARAVPGRGRRGPADVGTALARYGIAPPFEAVVVAVTARGWRFTLGVRYEDVGGPIPSAPRFWAAVRADPTAVGYGEGATPAGAVGRALVAVLDRWERRRPPRRFRLAGRE